MIGYITGSYLGRIGNKVIILTNSGIGNEVNYVGLHHSLNDKLSLYTTHIVRETSEELYGFIGLDEKKIFEALLNVKGVGPKSAFALTITIGVQNLINAIVSEDKDTLKAAPGIGAKAAAQIILDLKDKVSKILEDMEITLTANSTQIVSSGINSSTQEAVDACVGLGYRESDILKILKQLDVENYNSQEIVKLVLKEVH